MATPDYNWMEELNDRLKSKSNFPKKIDDLRLPLNDLSSREWLILWTEAVKVMDGCDEDIMFLRDEVERGKKVSAKLGGMVDEARRRIKELEANIADWETAWDLEVGSPRKAVKWTTEKPIRSGWYWIYTVLTGEDEPQVQCVKVDATSGGVSFDIPVGGLDAEDWIFPERTLLWYGPIEPPQLPK